MKGWGKDFGNLKILPKWCYQYFSIFPWKWDDDLNLTVCKGFSTAAVLLKNTSLPSFYLFGENPADHPTLLFASGIARRKSCKIIYIIYTYIYIYTVIQKWKEA